MLLLGQEHSLFAYFTSKLCYWLGSPPGVLVISYNPTNVSYFIQDCIYYARWHTIWSFQYRNFPSSIPGSPLSIWLQVHDLSVRIHSETIWLWILNTKMMPQSKVDIQIYLLLKPPFLTFVILFWYPILILSYHRNPPPKLSIPTLNCPSDKATPHFFWLSGYVSHS
jgi:hypothetical protein